MLTKLQIEHYAIIDELHLDFHEGMTVLTGETGAGKSIIVDALSLLLGERASKEMISSKADTATVIGLFTLDNEKMKHVLRDNEIDFDDTVEILRTISKDNRNLVRINNQLSSIKVLRELAMHLADIHSQFDTNRLINPENYLSLIDNYRKERVSSYVKDYQNSLHAYQSELTEYHKLQKEKEETLKKLDLFQFQWNELKDLHLQVGEEDSLMEQVNLMENLDKINTVLEQFNVAMDEGMILDQLYRLKQDLSGISNTSSEFESLSNRMNDLYYELDDIHSTLQDKLERLEYNQSDYEAMNTRLHTLEKIRNKYNQSIEELLEYQKYLETQVERADNYDAILTDQQIKVKDAFDLLMQEALKLREFRKDLAGRITKEIKETLNDLVILNADFEIRFEEDLPKDEFDNKWFTESGIDAVDFYISTNLGEPLKQLSKTASGGEMSRVMLAFKSIFVRSNQISTIIFDEIDTGISGYIAKQIAKKIQEISKISQVISITHIPQVVATGTHHIAVRKEIVKNHTKISVGYLDYNQRVEEIAKMISADKVTQASMESAKELLISE
ncbi:MAG: DNA repair protein RecN [Bacilli bacterium]|nr:DNA repair protein RecN [Bacilli bacterium]MBN2877397.1 DNA repair protein RecN [Bacilli bacterium]